MSISLIRNILFHYKPLHFFILILSLVLLLGIQMYMSLNPGDFCQDYYAAKYFVENKSIYAPIPCGELLYNVHPPITTVFFLPFILLPLISASIIWSVFNIGFYLASLFLLLWIVEWISLRTMMLLIVGSLLWQSLFSAAANHNVAQLFLLLLTITWIMKRTKHMYLAGVILGILSLIKIWPVVLLVGSLLVGQKKTALAGFVTIGAGIVLTLLIFQSSIFVTYAQQISPYEKSWIMYPHNISLLGVTTKLFTGYRTMTQPLIQKFPDSITLGIGYILSAIVICGTYLFLYLYNKITKFQAQELLIEGLLLTIALLTFPIIWDFHMILLLLPCAIIITEYRKYFKTSKKVLLLFVGASAVLLNPMPLLYIFGYIINRNMHSNVSLFYSIFTINLIFLAIAQIVLALQIKKKLLLAQE